MEIDAWFAGNPMRYIPEKKSLWRLPWRKPMNHYFVLP
jgi:hypothetical protein